MVGANTEPCGTPNFKRTVLLRVCPILTCKVLLVSQDLRNLKNMEGRPSLMALWRTPMSQTLSNAFFASKKIMIVGSGWVALIDLV